MGKAPLPAPGGFTGFRPAALAFFEQLAANQNREWFQANKAVYEAEVRAPMEALVGALAFAFEVHDIPLTGDAKRSLFRINRDVRFSKDKSPYKTHASAVLSRDGSKQGTGIFYIQVGGSEGVLMALGFHEPEPEDLAGLRHAMMRDVKRWQDIEAGLARHKLALSREAVLSRIPKGFEAQAGSPIADALKLKRLIVSRRLAADRVFRPDLVDDAVAFAQAGLPLLTFGRAAIDRARGQSPTARHR